MLCRQVVANINGIEQIFIIKTENGEEPTTNLDTAAVDVKQESPSDDEQSPEGKDISTNASAGFDTRKIVPNTNGIEQIFITKSESTNLPMDPEEVDVKQEPPNDDEQLPQDTPMVTVPSFSPKDIIKDEPLDLDDSGNVKDSKAKCTKKKVHVCETCGKSFRRNADLKQHHEVHWDYAPHKCEICEKSFKAKYRLIAHRSVHTGQKPFVCHCGSSFTLKGSLNKHQRTYCGQSGDSEACECSNTIARGPRRTSISSERFKCSQCNRKCCSALLLERHMEKHVEASAVCDVCGKTFGSKTRMLQHRQFHKSTKRHVCDLCPASFHVTTWLRKHRKTHFNEGGRNYIPGLRDEKEPSSSESERLEGLEVDTESEVERDAVSTD